MSSFYWPALRPNCAAQLLDPRYSHGLGGPCMSHSLGWNSYPLACHLVHIEYLGPHANPLVLGCPVQNILLQWYCPGSELHLGQFVYWVLVVACQSLCGCCCQLLSIRSPLHCCRIRVGATLPSSSCRSCHPWPQTFHHHKVVGRSTVMKLQLQTWLLVECRDDKGLLTESGLKAEAMQKLSTAIVPLVPERP